MYSGAVFEFLLVHLKKGVFTSVSSEYRTRAPCPGTKCERCLSLLRRGLSVFWGGWGERKRERKGVRWEGEREKRDLRLPPFPSSRRPPRAFYCFFRLLLFYMDSQRELLWRRETLPLFLNYMGWHRKTNDISSVSVAHIFSTYF